MGTRPWGSRVQRLEERYYCLLANYFIFQESLNLYKMLFQQPVLHLFHPQMVLLCSIQILWREQWLHSCAGLYMKQGISPLCVKKQMQQLSLMLKGIGSHVWKLSVLNHLIQVYQLYTYRILLILCT